jgi:acetylglutamate kinase
MNDDVISAINIQELQESLKQETYENIKAADYRNIDNAAEAGVAVQEFLEYHRQNKRKMKSRKKRKKELTRIEF